MPVILDKLSPQEYFDLEKGSEIRHEYVDGILFPMSGESRLNNKILRNCDHALYPQLSGTDCEIYTHAVRLIVKEGRIYRYPDLVITCAEETDSHAVTQPCLIIEVLSTSTEQTDRNQKLKEYTSLPSLDYYLLVSTDEAVVECYSREPDGGWRYSFCTGLAEAVKLEKVKGIVLKLADVYTDISFSPPQG
ncbi:MAG: Uma2 family endonuclease [Cytophagales bacterium]|nr:Uma2 family endonuclease [Cytophagales bacterium]